MGSVINLNRNRSNDTAGLAPPTKGAPASSQPRTDDPGAHHQTNGAVASSDIAARTNGAIAAPGASLHTNRRVAASGAAVRNYPSSAARNYEDESWKSLLVLVVVFTATAIAMSVAVVLAGSNTWAEAMPLIVFVVVFALTKIFLANALFYVMIRSDAHSESVAEKRAVHNKANGLVIRRPRIPPGFNRPKLVGARPRTSSSASKITSASKVTAATKSTAAGKVRLAILTRKPPNPPPRSPQY
jgi:hypothetical protein